jgi:hypothetical protein
LIVAGGVPFTAPRLGKGEGMELFGNTVRVVV